MNERDNNIENKTLKNIFIITLISSLIITIITRLEIDTYTKNIILPIIIILFGYTYFMNTLKKEINIKSYFYLFLIIIVLLSYYIVPIADINKLLNILVIGILTSVYVYSLINPNYKIDINFIKWFTKLFPGYLFSNMEFISPAMKSAKVSNQKNNNILKGVLISIPFLIIIISLLTHGDAYFKMFITKLLSTINIDLSFNTLVSITITIVLSFIFIFSTITNIYQTRNTQVGDIKKKKVDNTISYILLSVINFAYLLFLISEISKLTTNFLNIPVEYTYAKYAREGFFELLGVSTINFSVLIFYNKLAEYDHKKTIKYLLLSLIIFSILLIFNSYYRMILYITEYSFTILRMQVVLFLTMELIFFIIILIKQLKKTFRERPYLYFAILITTYLLNIYLCQTDFINYINSYFKYWIG